MTAQSTDNALSDTDNQQPGGVGISEIANNQTDKHTGETWLCPYCDNRVKYGDTCPTDQHGKLNMYGLAAVEDGRIKLPHSALTHSAKAKPS